MTISLPQRVRVRVTSVLLWNGRGAYRGYIRAHAGINALRRCLGWVWIFFVSGRLINAEGITQDLVSCVMHILYYNVMHTSIGSESGRVESIPPRSGAVTVVKGLIDHFYSDPGNPTCILTQQKTNKYNCCNVFV